MEKELTKVEIEDAIKHIDYLLTRPTHIMYWDRILMNVERKELQELKERLAKMDEGSQ